jgi:nucleoside triphosphatase
VGAATFVIKGTEILLGRSKKLANKIVIPGGGVRPFEKVNDAARREILEETGIVCLVDDILFVSELVAPPYEHRIILYMLGQYVDGEPVAGDDLSEVFWCDTRKLADYQDDMTDLTIDAICKFHVALRSRSMTQRAS